MNRSVHITGGFLLGLCVVAAAGIGHAAAPGIFKKGASVQGTCTAKVRGQALMDGPCSGLGHGNTVFVTAARDGCSIELERRGQTVVGKIFAYKDSCGDLQDDVSLGFFTEEGTCWRSPQARVCLSR